VPAKEFLRVSTLGEGRKKGGENEKRIIAHVQGGAGRRPRLKKKKTKKKKKKKKNPKKKKQKKTTKKKKPQKKKQHPPKKKKKKKKKNKTPNKIKKKRGGMSQRGTESFIGHRGRLFHKEGGFHAATHSQGKKGFLGVLYFLEVGQNVLLEGEKLSHARAGKGVYELVSLGREKTSWEEGSTFHQKKKNKKKSSLSPGVGKRPAIKDSSHGQEGGKRKFMSLIGSRATEGGGKEAGWEDHNLP